MARRPLKQIITRRKAKWAGLVLCLLLAAVFVSSRWMFVGVEHWPNPSLERHARLAQGRIAVARIEWGFDVLPELREVVTYGRIANPKLNLWFDWLHQEGGLGFETHFFCLPLWMPLLLLAVPTAWLWRSDRRIQPWQCRGCRYDLRGLEGGGEEGVCPECGLAKGEG